LDSGGEQTAGRLCLKLDSCFIYDGGVAYGPCRPFYSTFSTFTRRPVLCLVGGPVTPARDPARVPALHRAPQGQTDARPFATTSTRTTTSGMHSRLRSAAPTATTAATLSRASGAASAKRQSNLFKKNGGLAWSERFDRINAHFIGKGRPKCDITDWKSIESEPLETFQDILPETQHIRPTTEYPSDYGSGAKNEEEFRRRDHQPPHKRRAVDDATILANKRIRQEKGFRPIDYSSALWVCISFFLPFQVTVCKMER
ncbi:hypothetical protein OQA88_4501, partial [Cercophora sp. LCS_1]